MTLSPHLPTFRGNRPLALGVGSSLAGFAYLAFAFRVHRREVCFAYLTAFAFVASVAVGALFFIMIHHAAGAHWNTAVRRLNELVIGTLPALFVLFLPLVFTLGELYPWARDTARLGEEARTLLAHQRVYLNPRAFLLRSLVYFGVWGVIAGALRHRSFALEARKGAAAPSSDPHRGERVLCSATLPFAALAITFAAFDWLMSLEPGWHSTMFGLYLFAGGFVASIGLLCVLSRAAESARYAADAIRPAHYHALGRLMLAFTIFWAYCAFFQALLIQIADKPEEVVYYLERVRGGWATYTLVLALVRFVVPFFLLLPRAPKFDGRLMASIGAWVLAGHYLDVFWLAAPADAARPPWPLLIDLAALTAVGGATLAYGAARARGRILVPVGDPMLPASIQYRSPL